MKRRAAGGTAGTVANMAAVFEAVANRLPSSGDGHLRRSLTGDSPAQSGARPPGGRPTEDDLRQLLEHGETRDVADVLLSIPEADRQSLAGAVRACGTAPGARTADAERREANLLVAGAACLSHAGDIVSWVRSRRFRQEPSAGTIEEIVRVLAAPGRPELASVAGGLAEQLPTRPTARHDGWPLTAAVLRAAGPHPPATEPVVRGWIREHAGDDQDVLAERLAADPWLDPLLPQLFRLPGVAAALDRRWPVALGRLAAAGRVDRGELIRLVLYRLRADARATALRPAIALHRLLEPTPGELAPHRADYLRLLSTGPVAAAELAQDADTVVAAGRAVLSRTAKLIRAQLVWLDRAVTRHPQAAAALLETVALALTNESVVLAEQALAVLARHPGGTDVLRDAIDELGGHLVGRAEEILGVARPAQPRLFPPAPVPSLPQAMPPPVASAAELAAEIAAGLREPLDPTRLERLLAGVAALAHTARAEVEEALAGTTLEALLPSCAGDPPAPLQVLSARVRELDGQLATGVPPTLLATPATVDGHVNPARLLLHLVRAERDGWQPGRHDFAQALLRLPRKVDPAVTTAAGRLASPAGRRYAAWLRTGGLPEPAVTMVPLPGEPRRRTVAVAGPDLPGLAVPRRLLALPATEIAHDANALTGADLRCWPWVLPSHRDVIAAHCLPYLAPGAWAADLPDTAGAVLPALARAAGPFGPAMAMLLACGLTAPPERQRVAAVDAVLHLARTGGLDASLLGRELARLLGTGPDGDDASSRAAESLDSVGRAGAWHVVWAVAHTAVPVLLRLEAPPAGMPALLTVAASAAAHTGARADLPEVTAAATSPGRSGLRAGAARLARAIR